MTYLYSLIILLPLMSFITICVFGRMIGVYGSLVLSIINILISLLFTAILFIETSFSVLFCTQAWDWLSMLSFDVTFSLRYDGLTGIMFLIVTFVSSCVHVYSSVYMYTDQFLSRFMSYLSLFTFFMLLLVASNNFLVLFLGWEGVGLCSYLLIGFWYTRVQAGKAATKAFLINKVGDLFLLSGIIMHASFFYSLNFATGSAIINLLPSSLVELIAVLLFFGAVGKSAQIGLHTWLPDAMEGPTPVSALIHAATMVTAGVFLVIRCSYVFEYAPRILIFVALLGGVTALISGTIGSVQNDIKKIIAYSTCSQLGYMILICGLSSYNLGLFHLFNHAFFKALLFLSAGSIIHIMGNEQDIRKMGGLASLSPFIYINVTIASLALMGFPFLAGFYSKDLIIESTVIKLWVSSPVLYWIVIMSAALTVLYSFRLLEQVFWSDFMGFKVVIVNHIKMTIVEYTVLGLLGLLSLVTGYVGKDLFSGLGVDYFNSSIVALPTNWLYVEADFLSWVFKLLPFVIVLISFEMHSRLFECKWYYNEFVNGFISLPTLVLSRHYFEQYEKLALELNGPIFFMERVLSTLYYTSTNEDL